MKRMDLGLRQKDVARLLDVSVCTITNWELGHTSPTAHYALEIARFLEHVGHPDGESPLSDHDPALVVPSEKSNT
jgi:transcriptional regulator with XRE-family HTH domain